MVFPLLGQSAGVMEHCKISNSKHQIANKSQIPILNDQNRFGIWNFGYCDLEFLSSSAPMKIAIFTRTAIEL
jgi:hypothetical protein